MARDEDVDYAELLRFRIALRTFMRWSEEQVRAAGVTPAQHQLLLCVRGHGDSSGPTIADLAEYLLLRHNSVVELVNRAEAAELVRRRGDDSDGRLARVTLTRSGAAILRKLTDAHLAEVRSLGHLLAPMLNGPAQPPPSRDLACSPERSSRP